MAKHIRDLMTPHPVTLSAASTFVDAAIAMRDFNVGAVIVADNGRIYGIVTDRDIVVRAKEVYEEKEKRCQHSPVSTMIASIA